MNFESLIDTAFKASIQYKKTFEHALDNGITPREIVDYAFGRLSPPARDAFHRRLLQSSWALSRVVALVKEHQRDPALFENITEALRLLDTGHPDPLSAGCTLLGEIGC
jgi:hypothetical protein